MLKRRQKRWGSGIDEVPGSVVPNRLRRRIKHVITVGVHGHVQAYEEKSWTILRLFITEYVYRESMRSYGRDFYQKILFMQRRMKNQLVIRFAKVEVLLNYWDKLFGILQ